MTSGLQLVMSQGPRPGEVFPIDRDVLTLGREPTNAIVINEPQVSRQHARLSRQGGAIVIEDLGSTNGTFVNGMRLMGPRALAPGDVVGLGEIVTLTFYDASAISTEDLGAAPPEPPAAPYGAPRPGPQAYAPAAYAPRPPVAPAAPSYDDEDVEEGEEEKGGRDARRRQYLFVGCGCLALFFACLAVALFLWFAPASFWEALIELGIPIPSNPF